MQFSDNYTGDPVHLSFQNSKPDKKVEAYWMTYDLVFEKVHGRNDVEPFVLKDFKMLLVPTKYQTEEFFYAPF